MRQTSICRQFRNGFFFGNDRLKFVVHGKADARHTYFALEVL